MANYAIIDSHAHLDYPQLAHDLPAVLARAKTAGVSHVITIGVKLSTTEKQKKIAETFDNVWYSVGIHPHEAGNEENACNINAIKAAADHPKCVAIGEAGLDYFMIIVDLINKPPARTQIAVARDMRLPIIVHSRDADEDMAVILEDEISRGTFSGVMHCFSSGAELAERAMAVGRYISFSGILTFNKSTDLQTIAAKIPLNRLLVETDSPYLAPTPHRGKINEPAFAALTLAKLAEIRSLPMAQMAAITRQNTARLFSKVRLS